MTTRRQKHRSKAIQDCLQQVVKNNPSIKIKDGKEKSRIHGRLRSHRLRYAGTTLWISGDCPGCCKTCLASDSFILASDSFIQEFINIGAFCPKCYHKIHYCDYRYMKGSDKKFPLCPKCKHTVTEEEIFKEPQ
jgi:hypothetical protein